MASERPTTLLDAYSGVGLFAGSLLAERAGWRAVVVENNRSSAADARTNLADLEARVIRTTVERLRVPRADLVVADPSRSGLGACRGVGPRVDGRAVHRAGELRSGRGRSRPSRCSTALGYQPREAVVVDLFPHTHHTEVVTRFDRD